MELNGAKILYTIHTDIPLLGDFKISQTLVSTWIVMALLSGLAIWLGSNLKLENVSKRQAAAEFIVERLDQFVHDNMGYHFDKYIPLIGAIFALSIGCNLISVIGLWSPTADLNTEAAWAIVVFVLIMYYKIKTNGILSYLKGLLDPIFIMAPINVLSEVSTPVSMAFRHFGNILSGTVISTLLYWALASLSHVIFGWLPGALSQIQLFQIGIPAFTGLYFDWFGGCIQAFIFCTLTAIFINRAAGNVLAVYVLDGTVQTFLLKWIDFKPYAGSWFLVFLAIGYALAIMIIACLLNEVRKATIGRLEPWLVNVVNAVVMWGVNAVRGVVRRLLTYFIG